MLSQKQTQQFYMEYRRQLFVEAEKMRMLPMPELTEELFSQFEKNGNRSEYETVYFARRKFLCVFGIKAILEKKQMGSVCKATQSKLSEVIADICREECWAVPAHLSRKNPDWRITIDLFAAETAQTLSELTDRLRDELPAELWQLVRENVENRVLFPFLRTKQYGWEKSDHNWNAVCAGSIGSACIHLWGEDGRTDRCIDRVCDSLLYYIEGFAEDGTCMEGGGYYTYGMSCFVNFAQELFAYSLGNKDLLRGDWGHFHKGDSDKRSKIAGFQSKCFFADGTTVNFSDGSCRDKYSLGLLLALKRCFPEVRIPDVSSAADLYHDNCYRFVFRKLDLLESCEELVKVMFPNEVPDPPAENACIHILPDAQWCIATARNNVGFACKGGSNGEPHNHNDVGHFIYEAKGTAFLADLGAGEYTKEYFGPNRYHILCNNSFGHSVPIINGRGQLEGKEYACNVFEADRMSDRLQVQMDLSGAYGERADTIRRGMRFSVADGKLVVTDSFSFDPNKTCTVTENLITQCKPYFSGDRILLAGSETTAQLRILGNPDILIREYPHIGHRGEKETVYAIVWQVSPPESKVTFEIEIVNA